MSSLLRKRRPTTSGAHIESSSSKKQRLIDATKMLLDVAKESADAFAPLKSCLGGLCALIKHYEESKDVEEKLGDLIPWLTKLKGSVRAPRADGDSEDTERCEQLIRSLEDIEKRSLVLLEKGKAARIFDKKQDSGMIVKLVEELRQAILIYQLSQQQAIESQVAQLTSSFKTFLKLREKPQGVNGKVDSILQRLNRLDAEGSTVGDRNEHKRRRILFEALEGIKDELLPISERSSAVGYKGNDADTHAVCELAEDVRDAIMEYQFTHQEAIYEQNCRLIDSDERTVLNNYPRARGAGYQHGDRNGCLKGTRENVLDDVARWTEDSETSPVFWLNGLAGTGKTAIAQTIAESVFAEGRLGASFFCSRDFEDRSDLRFIFPTLAFQLAYKYPGFRSHFVSLLRTNPDIVYESLYNQMQKLIAEPLQAAGVSTVIVIDALDECKDDEPSSAILSVLGRFVGQISGVKFFITGRPEPRIRTGFRLPILIELTDVFILHDVHPTLVNSDIRLFLKHELSGLAQQRQLGRWPTDESIDVLCLRAAGLFVYAVATVKFLSSHIHLPKHRLDVILKLPESTAPEGTTLLKPETTLDSLYTSILQAAFSTNDSGVYTKVRAIIGTVVMVVNPLPPQAIAELASLELEEVTLFLTSIQSLLAVDEGSNQPVKPFHKSFPDFVTDPLRCPDARFFISPRHLHHELAMNCLRVMNDGLDQDLLSLPEYALNSEVRDLQTRIDDRISIALRYACRSWHNHIIESRDNISNSTSLLRIFLEKKFLAWLEVLSVLGGVREGVVALEKLMPWLQEFAKDKKLLKIVRDGFYFVTRFFEPINASATHIYHSALELCPTSSIVLQLYYSQASRITRLPRVLVGTPSSWDPSTSISGKDEYLSCTWSPCGRFIAALTGDTAEIRNQLTSELLTTLRPTRTTHPLVGPLVYSPDGRSVASASNATVTIWDIQTGGVAKEIEVGTKTNSLVWSLDGRTICTVNYPYQDTRHKGRVNAYEVASGTPLFLKTIYSSHLPHLMAHETSFQVVTTAQNPLNHAQIQIRRFGVPSLSTIHTFDIDTEIQTEDIDTDYTPGSEIVSFSSTASHLSVVVGNILRVFRDQSPRPLLKISCRALSSCFSSDGSLFAISKERDVDIWYYYPDLHRYLWSRKFQFQGINSPQFSPSFSSFFLGYSGNALRVYPLHQPPPDVRASSAPTSGIPSTTIITPHSQPSPPSISAIMSTEGLLFTGNFLLVVPPGHTSAWLLTEEGLTRHRFHPEMDGHDRAWSMSFEAPDPNDNSLATSRPKSTSRPKAKSRPKTKSRTKARLVLHIEGQIRVTEHQTIGLLPYRTATGETLQSIQTFSGVSGPGYELGGGFCGRHYLQYHNVYNRNILPGGGWYPSDTSLQEGWVKDPEGRHRFWLPVEWRKSWDLVDWCHNIMTQFSIIKGQTVVVKF